MLLKKSIIIHYCTKFVQELQLLKKKFQLLKNSESTILQTYLIAVPSELRNVLDVLFPDAWEVAHQIGLGTNGRGATHGPHLGVEVLAPPDVVEGGDLHVSEQRHDFQILRADALGMNDVLRAVL